MNDAYTTTADLYERIEADIVTREAKQRASLLMNKRVREYLNEQPKKVLVLGNQNAPGCDALMFHTGLPRQWVGSNWVTRLEARRA